MHIYSIIIVSEKLQSILLDYSTIIKLYGCNLIIVVSDEGDIKLIKGIDISFRKFNDNYSDLKNYALGRATTEWVLFVDSDELLSDDLIKHIPDLISAKDVDGYWIPRKTFISKDRYLKYGLFYPDYQLRLFRRKKEYNFENAVHEVPNIPKEKTKEIPWAILHYPQNPKYTKFSDFKNLIPHARIAAETMAKGEKSNIYLIYMSIYMFFFLFLSGFFRGKGFLDGWAGFNAHILFAAYISYTYILAIRYRMDK